MPLDERPRRSAEKAMLVLGAMSTALRGYIAYDCVTHMPTQSGGHGTQRDYFCGSTLARRLIFSFHAEAIYVPASFRQLGETRLALRFPCPGTKRSPCPWP